MLTKCPVLKDPEESGSSQQTGRKRRAAPGGGDGGSAAVADLGFEPRVCLGKTSRYNMVQFNMQFGNITTKFSK